jgi:putative SOS response-associated peptidase YedK
MCNLYTTNRSAAEVAAWFRATPPALLPNLSVDILPGSPGLVVTERAGDRRLESMTRGFPMRVKGMKETSKPKPVNNVADIRKSVWIGFAKKPQWRCLIPATAFCEAEGVKGKMTRTWMSLPDQPLFAWAGLWRESEEWGPVYSGVMTDSFGKVDDVHDRMPVILLQDEWDRWMHGSIDECVELQNRLFPGKVEITRTDELWSKTSKAAKDNAAAKAGQISLLRDV